MIAGTHRTESALVINAGDGVTLNPWVWRHQKFLKYLVQIYGGWGKGLKPILTQFRFETFQNLRYHCSILWSGFQHKHNKVADQLLDLILTRICPHTTTYLFLVTSHPTVSPSVRPACQSTYEEVSHHQSPHISQRLLESFALQSWVLGSYKQPQTACYIHNLSMAYKLTLFRQHCSYRPARALTISERYKDGSDTQ